MRVSNLTSPNGNPVPNQFRIDADNGEAYFRSYNSIIVKIGRDTEDNREVLLDEYYWNYLRTTSKYCNIFLGESTKETEDKLNKGAYKFANLN
jgi:hypothetical protein